MMRKVITSVIASTVGRKAKSKNPVAGAVIGAGATFAARHLFPQRYAVIAATAAAAYLTRKWAESAKSVAASKAAHAADPQLTKAGVVDVAANMIPTDGQQMGDALPPAIPLHEKRSGTLLH